MPGTIVQKWEQKNLDRDIEKAIDAQEADQLGFGTLNVELYDGRTLHYRVPWKAGWGPITRAAMAPAIVFRAYIVPG